MKHHLKRQIEALEMIEKRMDYEVLKNLLDDAESTVRRGNKIIATALGKNVPICEKFVGTLISLGIDAFFLHTNSAVHGDLGAVKDGDLVIILSKSGETSESVYLYEQLKMRNVIVWVMSYNGDSTLCREDSKKLVLYLEHEGDKWNLVPNNSSIGFLLVLQSIAMELADRLDVGLDVFKKNHPGGYIGKTLSGM